MRVTRLQARGYSRLTGGVLQVLGGETDGALDVQVAVLCAGDEVTADYCFSMVSVCNLLEDRLWEASHDL